MKEVCATAVVALQEQLDRLEECEYCNSVTYCPNCGRNLTND